MDSRQKQTLERELERYRALLRLVTDEWVLAALKQLIKETMDLLDDRNKAKPFEALGWG
jgi:hypothetical protein